MRGVYRRTTGEGILLSSGPVLPALLTTSAKPSVLPAVRIDGKWCMDCGVADDTPISRALRLGAETVGAAQQRSRRAAELAQHCSEDGAARVEVAAALWSGR